MRVVLHARRMVLYGDRLYCLRAPASRTQSGLPGETNLAASYATPAAANSGRLQTRAFWA